MILTFFYYKVSFLIKSDGNLFVIRKYMYNHARLTFFSNLEVVLNLMVFMGTKDVDGEINHGDMLEVTPNQYLQVEFEDHLKFIKCSLKSFPFAFKLDDLVVIIHDVIYTFDEYCFIIFSHFFYVFSKR